jgi:hypothetical protein
MRVRRPTCPLAVCLPGRNVRTITTIFGQKSAKNGDPPMAVWTSATNDHITPQQWQAGRFCFNGIIFMKNRNRCAAIVPQLWQFAFVDRLWPQLWQFAFYTVWTAASLSARALSDPALVSGVLVQIIGLPVCLSAFCLSAVSLLCPIHTSDVSDITPVFFCVKEKSMILSRCTQSARQSFVRSQWVRQFSPPKQLETVSTFVEITPNKKKRKKFGCCTK